jgi:Holliday junction resolvase RusA-like endonuclease
MSSRIITLPLEVWIPRKTREDKKIILNLNVYRNCHHMTLNAAKREMKLFVEQTAKELLEPISSPLRFTYTIFPATGRKFDLANVAPIVQKFTDDALVEAGFIKDDNYKIVAEVNYRFGNVDKENPRAELMIEEI